MDNLNNLAKQTMIYGVGHIAGRVVTFIGLSSYLSTWFSSEDFNLYRLFYSLTAICIVFFSFRLDTAIFRYSKQENDPNKIISTTFWLVLSASILLIPLCWYIGKSFTRLLGYDEKFMLWLALISSIDALGLVFYAQLRVENKALKFSQLRFLNVVLTIISFFFFFEWTPNIDWSFYLPITKKIELAFISNFFVSIIMLVILLYNVHKPKLLIDSGLSRKMLYYVTPLIIVSVATSITQYFAPLFQTSWLSDSLQYNQKMSGIYQGTQTVSQIMLMFTSAFVFAAEPFFFNNVDKSDHKALYANVSLFYTICSSVLIIGTCAYIDILKLMIGSDKHGAMYLILPMLLSYYLSGLYANVSTWFKLTDRTFMGAYIGVIGICVTIGLNFWLLPILGFIATPLASIASYLLMDYVTIWLGKKYYPIPYNFVAMTKHILLSSVLSIFITIINELLTLPYYYKISINTLLFLFYIVYIWVYEKEQVLAIIPKRLKHKITTRFIRIK